MMNFANALQNAIAPITHRKQLWSKKLKGAIIEVHNKQYKVSITHFKLDPFGNKGDMYIHAYVSPLNNIDEKDQDFHVHYLDDEHKMYSLDLKVDANDNPINFKII